MAVTSAARWNGSPSTELKRVCSHAEHFQWADFANESVEVLHGLENRIIRTVGFYCGTVKRVAPLNLHRLRASQTVLKKDR